jgi:aerobic carbon-monoxide dehydrogenase medium subunit
MNIPEFVHLVPRDLQEACSLLQQFSGQSLALAGGTDLLVKMKQRRVVPRYLVNLKKIRGLDYVRHEPGQGLAIGPLASIESVRNSLVVRKKYRILHDALSCMGTPEIRNCGTLAGNICNASPAAETVPALQLLGASARIIRPDGETTVPLEVFLLGPGRTLLEPGELVCEICVPEPPEDAFGAYDKFSLRRMDLAVVGAGALLRMDGPVCREARIILSAVGPTAARVRQAEAVLAGTAPDKALIEKAARCAAEEIRPQSDLHGTVEQKKDMAAVLAARVLRQALQRARKPGG